MKKIGLIILTVIITAGVAVGGYFGFRYLKDNQESNTDITLKSLTNISTSAREMLTGKTKIVIGKDSKQNTKNSVSAAEVDAEIEGYFEGSSEKISGKYLDNLKYTADIMTLVESAFLTTESFDKYYYCEASKDIFNLENDFNNKVYFTTSKVKKNSAALLMYYEKINADEKVDHQSLKAYVEVDSGKYEYKISILQETSLNTKTDSKCEMYILNIGKLKDTSSFEYLSVCDCLFNLSYNEIENTALTKDMLEENNSIHYDFVNNKQIVASDDEAINIISDLKGEVKKFSNFKTVSVKKQCNVFDKFLALSISKIQLAGDIKTEYLVDESLDLQFAKLDVVYNNGRDSKISITNDMLGDFDSSVAGNKQLSITFAEHIILVDYVVNQPE